MSEDTIQYLVLDRFDPICNMARYYVLSIEPSLFGNPTLIREWGRIGRPGRGGLSFMKTNHTRWKPLRPGSSESGAVATSSEIGRRVEMIVAGCVRDIFL